MKVAKDNLARETAYDLSLFDEKVVSINDRQRREKLERKVKVSPLSFTRVAVFAVVVAFISAILLGHAQITEISAEVSRLESSLKSLEEEATRLNVLIDNKTSLKNIETYAKDVLGMVELKSYQITYLSQQQSDKVVVSEQEGFSVTKALGSIQKTFDGFLEYLR